MVKITLEDIQKAFNRILLKLQEEGYKEFEFSTDFYRFIPTDQWENYSEDIVELGSLYDDVSSLVSMTNDEDRPCTYVDFDRVATILRAISQELNPPSDTHLQ